VFSLSAAFPHVEKPLEMDGENGYGAGARPGIQMASFDELPNSPFACVSKCEQIFGDRQRAVSECP